MFEIYYQYVHNTVWVLCGHSECSTEELSATDSSYDRDDFNNTGREKTVELPVSGKKHFYCVDLCRMQWANMIVLFMCFVCAQIG